MNKRILSKVFIFIAGAAAGSAATWMYAKTKYEQLLKESVDSVIEAFSDNIEIGEITEDADEEDEEPSRKPSRNEKPDIIQYASELSKREHENYSGYFNEDEDEEADDDDEVMDDETPEDEAEYDKVEYKKGSINPKPYVISPEEFGELDDYDQVSLTYYADLFLGDDTGRLIDDVQDKVGWESLNRFGEYEEDAVHVRNEALRTDFEILRVNYNYKD